MGAIVLAGGKSVRMGMDKASISFEGRTLLQNVVDTVGALAEKVIVVAARPDQYVVTGADVIGDIFPEVGPVGGIVTGLEAFGPGFHLAVACDMPFLQPALLRFLRDCAGSSLDAVVPMFNGRPEPLCSVYGFSAASKLRIFLEAGGRALHRGLEVLDTLYVAEDVWRPFDTEGASFTNFNTIDSLAPAITRQSGLGQRLGKTLRNVVE